MRMKYLSEDCVTACKCNYRLNSKLPRVFTWKIIGLKDAVLEETRGNWRFCALFIYEIPSTT